MYNLLQLVKGPLKSFTGCRIESFFVKVRVVLLNLCSMYSISVTYIFYLIVQLQSAISPDATHIVSGSSDGNAYVWQVTFLPVIELL